MARRKDYNRKCYCLYLNIENDKDIIEKLSKVDNINAYFKTLIREDIGTEHLNTNIYERHYCVSDKRNNK